MADVYVYCFVGWDGPTEADRRPRRRATLETIKAIGDPIMESQIVVDDAELDSGGFFCGSANDSHPGENVRNEIKSLNLRAVSRDAEALTISDAEADGGVRKYMLQLESRELRRQAKKLQKQCDVAAAESDVQGDALDFAQFGESPTAG
jgi:hypothetical protein